MSDTHSSTIGRPRKELKKRTFEKLCEIGCTKREVANVLDVDENTLDAWCERTYGVASFSVIYDRFYDVGCRSLRHKLNQLAIEGDVKVLIHLSKTRLGNIERQEVSGPDREPIVINYNPTFPEE
jgi:hypothetical protein